MKNKTIPLVMAISGALALNLQAVTWTTAVNGNWNDGTKWTGGVPNATAADLLLTGTNYTVTYNSVNPTFTALTITNSGTKTTLDVSAALTTTAAFNGTHALVNVNSGGTLSVGTLAQFGSSTVNIASGGTMYWATTPGSNLTLNNSTVNVSGSLLGGSGGGGVFANDGNTSNLNITGGAVTLNNFVLANRGTGNINITAGGSISLSGPNGIMMGTINNVNNVANINVTSGTLSNAGKLDIGIGTATSLRTGITGTSTFTVNGGSVTQSGVTYVGSGRVGILNVSIGSFTAADTDIIVGGLDKAFLAPTGSATASGAVNVSGGSLSTTALRIGDSIVVAGANAGYSVSGSLTLTGGTITTDLLSATNGANSAVTYSGGTLNTKATSIANGSTFTVGNGTSAAIMKLDGGNHSFANNLTVSNNATLKGTGTVTSGTVNVSTGGILAPGNSAGNLTINTGLTLAGSYSWELGALSTINPGTDFDTVTITAGNANITGATLTLGLGAFTPSAIPFWQVDQTWAGILNNTGGGTLTGTFAAIDNSAWASLGTFSTTYTGNDVNLQWSAVPEPNAATLVGGLGVMALLRRNRRNYFRS